MKELEVWRFIRDSLNLEIPVVLFIVADSRGSSPGRQGFKMAVSIDGERKGSIGGGIMEYQLVKQAIRLLELNRLEPFLKKQIHRTDIIENKSGMICSGDQTIIVYPVQTNDKDSINGIFNVLMNHKSGEFSLFPEGIRFDENRSLQKFFCFEEKSGHEWKYGETIGYRYFAYIIGGGHVGLAVAKVLFSLDFYIKVIDDMEGLSALEANSYVHENIVTSYENIGPFVPEGKENFVIIVTFGHRSDEIVLRQLLRKKFGYIGMMGSEAKLAKIFLNLQKDGFKKESFKSVYTPIGIPINSRTPEEIAISVAAQIIQCKNSC